MERNIMGIDNKGNKMALGIKNIKQDSLLKDFEKMVKEC